MDVKDCRIELKAVNDAGEFEGFAATYETVDEGGDSISPGAFSKTLQEGAAELPLLWQHNPAEPIGRVRLIDSPKGLIAKGRLILSVPKAREAYDLMKSGVVRGMSIGYRAVKEQMAGAVRRLKEIRLFEISIVTFPMNSEALVTSVKRQDRAPDTEALDAFRNAARDLKDFHRRMIDGD
jgi:HK97 family phage prohead protease